MYEKKEKKREDIVISNDGSIIFDNKLQSVICMYMQVGCKVNSQFSLDGVYLQ